MAGIRQHIIPRFLLKGFASRSEGNNIYAWVYKKNAQVYESNITNIAVEKNFYDKDDGSSADAEITGAEGDLARLVDDLRVVASAVELNEPRIPDLIAHLEVRTKHFRDSFREPSEYLLQIFSEYFSDVNNIKTFILRNPSAIKKAMENKLSELPLSPLQKQIMLQLMLASVPSLLNEKDKELTALFQLFKGQLEPAVPGMVTDGHVQALSNTPIPEPRVTKYGKLHWFVVEAEQSFIIGDVGCVFETLGDKTYKSITMKNDEIVNIYLPISTKRLLIGTISPSCPNIHPINLNPITAKHSREYFVFHKKADDALKLSSLIGTEAEIITKEELGQVFIKGINRNREGSLQ